MQPPAANGLRGALRINLPILSPIIQRRHDISLRIRIVVREDASWPLARHFNPVFQPGVRRGSANHDVKCARLDDEAMRRFITDRELRLFIIGSIPLSHAINQS
jgi:hypothetical protein